MSDYQNLDNQNKTARLGRYEHEEGFSDEDKQPEIVVRNHQQTYTSSNLLQVKKARPRFHEPKTKLRFIAHNKSIRTSLHDQLANKQYQNRSMHGKSLQMHKKNFRDTLSMQKLQPVIKTKRTLVGENLSIPHYAIQDSRALKSALISSGQLIAFQAAKQVNTHGFLRKFAQKLKQGGKKTFLSHKFNKVLRDRLKESFIMPKRQEDYSNSSKAKLVFNSDIESGNLELVAKVSDNQYNLFLRIDTNTHGHQNWFYFEVASKSEAEEVFIINVCNMKRDFKLIEKGQKVFIKEMNGVEKWRTCGTNISIKENTNVKIARGRIYQLSFSVALKPQAKYELAMLPAYTYSEMLFKLEEMEEKNPNFAAVQLLSYSLTGLAIPVLTITNKQSKIENKKVILVSCRVHPGQSVASFVAEGLMMKLLDQSNAQIKQMLNEVVFKIIPILNPDGVIFGNFRTNYLGIDLNRAFYSEDEIVNPEISTIKELGRQLKEEYGNRFLYFIDLHGHSSQKNVFAYGPNYEYNDPNFYMSRLLPKILNIKSIYFKYASCTFNLQDHKKHTARGFFLNELNVMTYTIESSYCMYDDCEGNERIMEVDDWIQFGKDLAESIEVGFKLRQANKVRNNRELKRLMEDSQEQILLKSIKSDLKKEVTRSRRVERKQKSEVDSDGESAGEDLDENERKDAEKKVLEISIPTFILPRVIKPAILYPTVTPKLFEVSEQREEGNFKILYTKRNKYNTLRMVNANSMYANYLKNLEDLDKFKPSARNIKLQKKNDV